MNTDYQDFKILNHEVHEETRRKKLTRIKSSFIINLMLLVVFMVILIQENSFLRLSTKMRPNLRSRWGYYYGKYYI